MDAIQIRTAYGYTCGKRSRGPLVHRAGYGAGAVASPGDSQVEQSRALGIMREDLRHDNILWNGNVGQALILIFSGLHRIVGGVQANMSGEAQLAQTKSDVRRLRAL